jgi:hypothetical protein
VGARYRALAAGPHGAAMNTIVVDGDRPPAAVHADVKKAVARLLDIAGDRAGKKGARSR